MAKNPTWKKKTSLKPLNSEKGKKSAPKKDEWERLSEKVELGNCVYWEEPTTGKIFCTRVLTYFKPFGDSWIKDFTKFVIFCVGGRENLPDQWHPYEPGSYRKQETLGLWKQYEFPESAERRESRLHAEQEAQEQERILADQKAKKAKKMASIFE